MKLILTFLCVSVLAIGCTTPAEKTENVTDDGYAVFEKNAQAVKAYLDAWQNENVDYDAFYSRDYEAWGTGFNDLDTMRFDQIKEWDQQMFRTFDFRILSDSINFLPGVNNQTKKVDGSVRLYSEWEITRTATDSTAAKTGNIRMYQTWVFNEEGKVTLDLTYGDFGGLMQYLFDEE